MPIFSDNVNYNIIFYTTTDKLSRNRPTQSSSTWYFNTLANLFLKCAYLIIILYVIYVIMWEF